MAVLTKEMVQAMADELAATTAEIQRLAAYQEGLRKVIENYRTPDGDRVIIPLSVAASTTLPSDKATEMVSTQNALVAAIADALSDGKPLHLSGIYDRLQEQGVFVPGKKPLYNLSSHMSGHKDQFENVGKGLWRLKSPQPNNPIPTNDESAQTHRESEPSPSFSEEEFEDVPF